MEIRDYESNKIPYIQSSFGVRHSQNFDGIFNCSNNLPQPPIMRTDARVPINERFTVTNLSNSDNVYPQSSNFGHNIGNSGNFNSKGTFHPAGVINRLEVRSNYGNFQNNICSGSYYQNSPQQFKTPNIHPSLSTSCNSAMSQSLYNKTLVDEKSFAPRDEESSGMNYKYNKVEESSRTPIYDGSSLSNMNNTKQSENYHEKSVGISASIYFPIFNRDIVPPTFSMSNTKGALNYQNTSNYPQFDHSRLPYQHSQSNPTLNSAFVHTSFDRPNHAPQFESGFERRNDPSMLNRKNETDHFSTVSQRAIPGINPFIPERLNAPSVHSSAVFERRVVPLMDHAIFEPSTKPSLEYDSSGKRISAPPINNQTLLPNLTRPPHYPNNRFPPPPYSVVPQIPPELPVFRPTVSIVSSTSKNIDSAAITTASSAPLWGTTNIPPIYNRPPLPPFFDPRHRFMPRPSERPDVPVYTLPGLFPPTFANIPPPQPIQADPKLNTNNSTESSMNMATLKDEEVWVQNPTSDGRLYFYNWKTRITSWVKPQGVKIITQIELNNILGNKTHTTISSGPTHGTTNSTTIQEHKSDDTSDWAEYKAPDGRFYYHNRRTAVTTWTKPQIMIDNEKQGQTVKLLTETEQSKDMNTEAVINNEKVKDTSVTTAESSDGSDSDDGAEDDEGDEESCDNNKGKPVASKPVKGTPWSIVWTGNGRVFFYNSSKRASVWERPDKLIGRIDVDKILEEPPTELFENATKGDKLSEPPIKKQKIVDEKAMYGKVMFNKDMLSLGKEAAKEAEERAAKERASQPLEVRMSQFREMLTEKSVSKLSTWEKELHKIIFDPRYLLLASSERKLVFEKYVKSATDSIGQEKSNTISEKVKQFRKLLSEANLSAKSTFVDLSTKYGNDVRFKSLASIEDREQMFKDYISELDSRDMSNTDGRHQVSR